MTTLPGSEHEERDSSPHEREQDGLHAGYQAPSWLRRGRINRRRLSLQLTYCRRHALGGVEQLEQHSPNELELGVADVADSPLDVVSKPGQLRGLLGVKLRNSSIEFLISTAELVEESSGKGHVPLEDFDLGLKLAKDGRLCVGRRWNDLQ